MRDLDRPALADHDHLHLTGVRELVLDLPGDLVREERGRVVGRCLAAGRSLGTADVEISAWDEPDRLVAVGRARFARRPA